MEFRILGPLEVFLAGEPVALGRGKERALLALLLLNRNQTVSRDRLVEELWGEAAPETNAAIALYEWKGNVVAAAKARAVRGTLGALA